MKIRVLADGILAAVVLACGACQLGLGARFNPTGEQVGLAIPLSSLVLAAAAVLAALMHWPPRLPRLGRGQAAFLALVAMGFLGLPAAQVRLGIKEWLQFAEFFILASFVFETIVRDSGPAVVRNALAGIGAVLLVLGGLGCTEHDLLALSPAKYMAMVTLSSPFLAASIRRRPAWLQAVTLLAVGAVVGRTFEHGGLLLCWAVALVVSCYRLRVPPPAAAFAAVAAALFISMTPALQPRSPWPVLNPRYDEVHTRRYFIETYAARLAPRHYPLGGGLGQYKQAIDQLKPYDRYLPHPDDRKVARDGNNQYALTLVESGLPAAVALLLFLAAAACLPLKLGAGPQGGGDEADTAAVRSGFLGALLAGLFCVLLSRGIGIWLGALAGTASACRGPVSLRSRLLRVALPLGAAAVLLGVAVRYNIGSADPGQVSAANGLVRGLLFPDDRQIPIGLRVVVLPADGVGLARGGVVQVEAEAYETITAPFMVVQANDVSGNRVAALPDHAGEGRGFVSYSVNVPEDGQYVLHARVLWTDACGNSLRFRINGDPVTLSSGLFQTWHVLDAKAPFDLKQGQHHVLIEGVEDGVSLDYWGLRRIR